MQKFKEAIIDFSLRRYKLVAVLIVLLTLGCGAFLPMIVIDTDPENMLEIDEPVRIFHNESKKRFSLSDTIVLGVINEEDPNGVFNPGTLKRIYELTEYAKSLRWKDGEGEGESSGVIEVDMIAPSLVDHMSQAGPGTISFEWLMAHPPGSREEAVEIRERALSNPLLVGQMVSADGRALCIYLPLTDKLLSYRVYEALQNKIDQLQGDEEYYIAGLPVAESAIGVEMFNQMTVAAPLTMLVIIVILYIFFRKIVLIILPMVVATVSVIAALGIMIGLGYPVHILSSMLPIFLMPIAICATVHVLSDFFECYSDAKGRRKTMKEVMQRLFTPILFTSLTTAAGFLSFLTTSIPPARLFGLFVAVGVMIAWLVTVFLVPAYVMIIPKRMLVNFGKSGSDELDKIWLSKFLQRMGNFSYTYSKSIIVAMVLIMVFAIWGVTNINVNDNYAKRFTLGHPIRQADMALNKHFGGTYTAFLNLGIGKGAEYLQKNISDIEKGFDEFAAGIEGDGRQVEKIISDINVALAANRPRSNTTLQYLDKIIEHVSDKAKDAPDEEYYVLQEIQGFFELEKEKQKIFKRPDVLKYMAGLQKCLEKSGLVGKTTSCADVIRKVNQELVDGRPENYRIPDKLRAVSECYMQYQGSHRPNDLWHLVTPDFMHANIRVQFTKGDSKQTEKTVRAVDSYLKAYKPPVVLSHSWSGLHYVNYIFQDKMFWEMLGSFASAFVIIFITMIILFRSFKWALICMIPLSFTIVTVYGATGIIGVDYDMPVAVMSAITLGMAVDFAIHLLERSRNIYREAGNWALSVPRLFGEPALAISRNVLVLALGFLPLMVAHLVPYKTTALMLFGIILFSGITTLLFLPAVLHIFEKVFFKEIKL